MSMTPWDIWMGMWRSGVGMARTGLQVAETMQASRTVVESRCRTMGRAARDPLNGDYGELARMVPEKVDAFARSASSAWEDMRAIQSDMIANWQQAARLALSGRPPSRSDVETMWSRSTRATERAMGSAGKALAPVHRSATANARRLRRRG